MGVRRLVGMDMVIIMDIMVIVMVTDVDAIMDTEAITGQRLTLHPKTGHSNLTTLLKDLAGDTDIRHTLCSQSRTHSSKSTFTRPHLPPSHSPSTNLWLAMS